MYTRPPHLPFFNRLKTREGRPPSGEGPGPPGVQGAHGSHTELSTGVSWEHEDNKDPLPAGEPSGPRNQRAWGPHANPRLGETQLGEQLIHFSSPSSGKGLLGFAHECRYFWNTESGEE